MNDVPLTEETAKVAQAADSDTPVLAVVPLARLNEFKERIEDLCRTLDWEMKPLPPATLENDEVREQVAEIRAAFGCGTIDASAFTSGDVRLEDMPGYINDVRHAVDRLKNGSIENLSDYVDNVSSELEYIERFGTLTVSHDVMERTERIQVALAKLETLGL